MVHLEQPLLKQFDLGGGTKRVLLKVVLVGIALTSFFGLVGPAAAESLFPSRHTDHIKVVGHAGPTQAWISFCQRQPHECRVDLSQPARIPLTPSIWAALMQVNERVNSSILAVTDQDHWGVIDRWDYPDDGLGDCEDIQLLKRKLLVEAGLPRRALLMTVVIDEQGQGHAALMVRTDRGDLILDNKRAAVLPWMKT